MLYIFLTAPDEVEKYAQSNSSDNCVHQYNVEILNLSDPELQLINTKPVIKNKFKELFKQVQFRTVRKEMIGKSSTQVINWMLN